MSRSYKKTPIIKDNGKSKKSAKKAANAKVRNRLKHSIDDESVDLASGRAYRKVYNSWDIADWVSRWTEQEARDSYAKQCTVEHYKHWHYKDPDEALQRFLKEYPTVESYLNDVWASSYKRK